MVSGDFHKFGAAHRHGFIQWRLFVRVTSAITEYDSGAEPLASSEPVLHVDFNRLRFLRRNRRLDGAGFVRLVGDPHQRARVDGPVRELETHGADVRVLLRAHGERRERDDIGRLAVRGNFQNFGAAPVFIRDGRLKSPRRIRRIFHDRFRRRRAARARGEAHRVRGRGRGHAPRGHGELQRRVRAAVQDAPRDEIIQASACRRRRADVPGLELRELDRNVTRISWSGPGRRSRSSGTLRSFAKFRFRFRFRATRTRTSTRRLPRSANVSSS